MIKSLKTSLKGMKILVVRLSQTNLHAHTLTSLTVQISIQTNHTGNIITIYVSGIYSAQLSYQIIDARGRKIDARTILSAMTHIDLGSYPAEIDTIKIYNAHQLINTFVVRNKKE
jgi:hypothetical protein